MARVHFGASRRARPAQPVRSAPIVTLIDETCRRPKDTVRPSRRQSPRIRIPRTRPPLRLARFASPGALNDSARAAPTKPQAGFRARFGESRSHGQSIAPFRPSRSARRGQNAALPPLQAILEINVKISGGDQRFGDDYRTGA